MTSETRPKPRERTISLRFGKNAIDQYLLNRLEGSGHNMSTELKRLAYERLLGLGGAHTPVHPAPVYHASVHHVQGHHEPSPDVTPTTNGATSAKPFQKKTAPVVLEDIRETGAGLSGAGTGQQGSFQTVDRQQQEPQRMSDNTEHIKANTPEIVLSGAVNVPVEHEDDGFDRDLIDM